MGLVEAQASLAGKFAIVVGGAAGIGRAVTLALAKAGIGIATCDIDAEACRTIVKEVEALGQKIISMQADVCDVAALDRFYDRVEQEIGQRGYPGERGRRREARAVLRDHAGAKCRRYPAQFRLCGRQHPPCRSLDPQGRSRWEHHQLHDHRGTSRRRDIFGLCRREGGDHQLQSRNGGRARCRRVFASI